MSQIEKAVLRTLIYSDLFDWPLKGWEVQKWLIKQSASLVEVEKALERMVKKGEAELIKGYFCLPRRRKIVSRRINNQSISREYLIKAERLLFFLRLVPWIELVGISGGLAVENVDEKADIDIFVVTEKNRLWLSRLIILGYLELVGVRRKRSNKSDETAGLICSNTLLDNASLAQPDNNIYIAHEVLQMRMVWDRKGVYEQFLMNNLWAFDWLPNWRSGELAKRVKKSKKRSTGRFRKMVDLVDGLARSWQLGIMKRPAGEERISDSALYFQPFNYQTKVLQEYRQQLKEFGLRDY